MFDRKTMARAVLSHKTAQEANAVVVGAREHSEAHSKRIQKRMDSASQRLEARLARRNYSLKGGAAKRPAAEIRLDVV